MRRWWRLSRVPDTRSSCSNPSPARWDMPAPWCATPMAASRAHPIRAATAPRVAGELGGTRAERVGAEEQAELQALGDALGFLAEGGGWSGGEQRVRGRREEGEPAREHLGRDAREGRMH